MEDSLKGADILKRIKEHRLSPEEGLHRILEMRAAREPFSDRHPDVGSSGADLQKAEESPADSGQQDIAVVGMACRFPGAGNIWDFWKNLTAGRDSVSEVPRERWHADAFYDPHAAGSSGKTISRWGGFLTDIDRFDPLFFNMSPKEAELTDPQHRLFLEEAWHTVEDAGYAPKELAGTKCGVFAGYNCVDYKNSLKKAGAPIDNFSFIGNLASLLPARISYFLNLKGPSIAVNTACSSSLVAVHLACDSIRTGTADVALAGGVQVLTTEEFHLQGTSTGMLSARGRCRTFDAGADGFVPGEGVGVVMLKSLERAIEDGDHIYAFIRGSGINQDGKTNGITAPGAPSQIDLESGVYARYKISPETIGYVEAHGTATELGDPIEVQALTDAFRKYTLRQQYCAIGSVKSNIGHTLAAAGIAGFIKAVLCLKHRQLVPSLHFRKPNPHIDFENSPFFVNTKLQPWKTDSGAPRRAAISAFGLSGTNAHVIVEEFDDGKGHGATKTLEESRESSVEPQLIVLSAKNEERLRAYAESMVEFLDRTIHPTSPIENQKFNLADMAHTLQNGRESMGHRLALVVSSATALKEKLHRFVSGEDGVKDLFVGNASDHGNRSQIQDVLDGRSGRVFMKAVIEAGELRKLGRLWVMGAEVEWEGLHRKPPPKRLPLPTYPFAKQRYWLPATEERAIPGGRQVGLHPLVGQNISTFKEEKFSTRITGHEFFLSDHTVAGRKTLPGVAYLEMARAAAEIAGEETVSGLAHVVWMRPLTVADTPIDVFIRLTPDRGGIGFEVGVHETDATEKMHAQGRILPGSIAEDAVSPIDIEAVRDRCPKIYGTEKLYRDFRSAGIEYGPGFQVVETLYAGESEALSKLTIPSGLGADVDAYGLHPSLMDGALQTVMGLLQPDRQTPYIPFAVEEVRWVREMSSACYAYAVPSDALRRGPGLTFDVDILDSVGAVLVRIRALTVRSAEQSVDLGETRYLEGRWVRADVAGAPVPADAPVIVFDTDTARRTEMSQRLQGDLVWVCPGKSFLRPDSGTFEVPPDDPQAHRTLFETLASENRFPKYIVHLLSQDPFVPDAETVNLQLQKSIFSLFHISKSLLEKKPAGEIRLLVLWCEPPDQPQPQYAAMKGFAKTLNRENGRILCRTVSLPDPAHAADIVANELTAVDGSDIRYRDGRRWIRRLREYEPAKTEPDRMPVKENGVYVITGGAGGLGLILAEYLINVVNGKVVLSGRSALNREKKKRIHAMGAAAAYFAADISEASGAGELIDRAKAHFGKIDGIIHCAGLIRDDFIIKKTPAHIREVLAPKVFGTIHLDRASMGEKLDFFVMFSSLSAETGNPGQCDYAYANSFMDHFAEYRENLRSRAERWGRTISINWPLWRDGGMQVDENTEAYLKKTFGLIPLKTIEGLDAFRVGLSGSLNRMVVFKGDRKGIARLVGETPDPAVEPSQIVPLRADRHKGLIRKLTADLKAMISGILKIDPSAIDLEDDTSAYGFDSISYTEFANRINDAFRLELSPAVFFEYDSVGDLANYLAKTFSKQLLEYYRKTTPAMDSPKTASRETRQPDSTPATRRFRDGFGALDREISGWRSPIAVVGMSGRMPGSRDLESFWRHIASSADLISEVSSERPGWNGMKGTISRHERLKWGGFMPDVDRFDPAFFNISPFEAGLMDPQQRIILQTAWSTVEDAGYRPSDLSGSDTGVFVGVAVNDYAEILRDHGVDVEAHAATGVSHAILANRISYLLDLNGPSEAIDTACSSSLVALHRAVEAIRSGTCEMALVGGVNVMLTPTLSTAFSKAGMLSPDGRCKTFDKRADGYVRGEGAGMIFLKPLDRAEADGDHIHAVILGSAENHDGHSTSLTAPNPKAQAKLLIDAYERSGIGVDTVSYIETHGTGTRLGDPIEINGLKRAFGELYTRMGKRLPDTPCCGLGSVKTYIGHLETAAGIAGIIKVLVSMEHRKLPGNLHFKELNPYIHLEDSPFYIVSETIDWKPLSDDTGRPVPRRAGISSFGIGGTNAHVVLEEYHEPGFRVQSSEFRVEPQLIVLSAKNEERLKAYAARVVEFIEHQKSNIENRTSKIENIAYTLQVGREAMDERLAAVVASTGALRDMLRRYLSGEKGIEDLYTGNTRMGGAVSDLVSGRGSGGDFLRTLAEEKDFARLAKLWTRGIEIDWNVLYDHGRPRRMSLPTYPFAAERCWVTAERRQNDRGAVAGELPLKTPLPDRIEQSPIPKETTEVERQPEICRRQIVEETITRILAEVLEIHEGAFDVDTAYTDMGVDSILGVTIIERINAALSITLSVTDTFNYPTPRKLADHILSAYPDTVPLQDRNSLEPFETLDDSDIEQTMPEDPNDKMMLTIIHQLQARDLDIEDAFQMLEALE